MRKILLFIVLVCWAGIAGAQSFERDYHFLNSGSPVQDKNFYLFTVFQQVADVREAVLSAASCQVFNKQKCAAIDSAIRAGDADALINKLKFTPLENQQALAAIGQAYHISAAMKEVVPVHLLPSGYFIRYEGRADSLVLMQSMQDAFAGINRVLDTYALGQKGRFPEIDMPLMDVNQPGFQDNLLKEMRRIRQTHTAAMFFEPTLQAVLYLLRIHKSEQAALYEPLKTGQNSTAIAAVKKTDWLQYPYAALVIPGNGPAGNEPLSKNGKERIKLAAEDYRRKLAPFIILTGGNVHPFQTPYNEAIEMKKELIATEHIPDNAIIVEPHARHTTTNIRNANRLIYRYGFPIGKKVLIVTDKKQATKIIDPEFVNRCREEIGHVPFVGLSAISTTEIEYLPVRYSLFMDSTDPLDP